LGLTRYLFAGLWLTAVFYLTFGLNLKSNFMSISRKEKEEALEKMTAELKDAKGVVFTQYRGLTVKEMDALRKKLRAGDVRYQVVKVTLLKKVLQTLGLDPSKLSYSGPLAIAFSQQDETAPARILKKAGDEQPKLKFSGGVVNHEMVGSDIIAKLALLPEKEILYGLLVSVISSPMRELVTVLSGNTRKLLNALNAIQSSKNKS
jgi:large subunit ribosomal protein L10